MSQQPQEVQNTNFNTAHLLKRMQPNPLLTDSSEPPTSIALMNLAAKSKSSDSDELGGATGNQALKPLMPLLGTEAKPKHTAPKNDDEWMVSGQYGVHTKKPDGAYVYKPLVEVKLKKEKEYSVSTLAYISMGVFIILYLIIDSNNDAFSLEEWLEALIGSEIHNPIERIVGYIIAVLSNLLVLPVIIYCWLKGNHDHDHGWGEFLFDYLAIGVPFFMIGVAAFYDSLSKFAISPTVSWVLPAALFCGLIGMMVNVKLHGYMAHEVAHGHLNENAGDSFIVAYMKGVYETFFTAKHKGLQGAFELWCKWGIVVGHALLGYFAAASFITQMQLAGYVIPLPLMIGIKVFLTALVTLSEGLTEAHSIDKISLSFKQYSYAIILTLAFCGFFHVLPALTAGSWLVSAGITSLTQAFPFLTQFGVADQFYSYAAMVIASAFILIPNWMGFAAMTAPTLDKTLSKCRYALFGGEKPAKDSGKHEGHDHKHKGHSHDHQREPVHVLYEKSDSEASCVL